MAQVLCKVFSFVLVILLGVVTARSGKLGKGADRLISKIVFNLTLPCAIIRAFESYDFNVSLLGLVGLGFAATVIPYFLSLFVYRNKPQQERIVQQLSVCGFNIGCFALAFVQAFFPAGCVVATCLFDAGNSLMGTGGPTPSPRRSSWATTTSHAGRSSRHSARRSSRPWRLTPT